MTLTDRDTIRRNQLESDYNVADRNDQWRRFWDKVGDLLEELTLEEVVSVIPNLEAAKRRLGFKEAKDFQKLITAAVIAVDDVSEALYDIDCYWVDRQDSINEKDARIAALEDEVQSHYETRT